MNDLSPPRKGKMPMGLPVRSLIPNAITVLALCSGLTGMRFALIGMWKEAALAIFAAGVLDGVDGRIARLLKGTSRFGAELDSLSDVIAFGVAPAFITYIWSLQTVRGFGWIIALSLAVCTALRLARFNAQIDEDDLPHKALGFNTGVPSPTGAGLALTPIFLCLWLKPDDVAIIHEITLDNGALLRPLGEVSKADWIQNIFQSPWLVLPWTAMVSLLLVTNLPTYSWKSIKFKPQWRVPILMGVGLFAGALLTETFATLSMMSIVYVAMLFPAWRSYKRQLAAMQPPVVQTEPVDLASSVIQPREI
jgi:CDP-diacylglycerol---serine O-phosphatidyltransferase